MTNPQLELKIIPGAVCQHLRSKGMYVSGSRDLNAETGDGYCWCNQTQNVLGPDDNLVDRARCNDARRCFQSVL